MLDSVDGNNYRPLGDGWWGLTFWDVGVSDGALGPVAYNEVFVASVWRVWDLCGVSGDTYHG